MNLAPAMTATSAVMQVGSDSLTRQQLAAVGCYNFLAARRLGAVLHEQLRVPNLRYVYEKIAPVNLAVPGLGVISLAALGAAFEALGLGDLETYSARHRKEEARVVTFSTIKHREAAEAAREAKERRQQQRRRQAKAHGLRVARFEQRAAAAAG